MLNRREATHASETANLIWLVIVAIAPLIAVWTLAINRGGYWWIAFLASFVFAIVLGSKAKNRLEELVRLSSAARTKKGPNQAPEPTPGSVTPRAK